MRMAPLLLAGFIRWPFHCSGKIMCLSRTIVVVRAQQQPEDTSHARRPSSPCYPTRPGRADRGPPCPAKASWQGTVGRAWPRTDHRRVGRRSQRHRDLFPSRRAVRLQHGMDAAVCVSTNVRAQLMACSHELACAARGSLRSVQKLSLSAICRIAVDRDSALSPA
jgi:hypothetical protein